MTQENDATKLIWLMKCFTKKMKKLILMRFIWGSGEGDFSELLKKSWTS